MLDITKGSLPTGYLEFYFAKQGGGLDPLSLNDQEKWTPPLSALLPSPDHMVPSCNLDRGWFSEWLNIVIIIIIIIIITITITITIIIIIITVIIIIVIAVIIVVIRLPKRSVVYDLLMFLMFIWWSDGPWYHVRNNSHPWKSNLDGN